MTSGDIIIETTPSRKPCAAVVHHGRRPCPPTLCTAPIPVDEPNRLVELEQIIAAGRQAFIEVGTALAEIRDSHLYKSNFLTFEDYCIGKWAFKRAHAAAPPRFPPGRSGGGSKPNKKSKVNMAKKINSLETTNDHNTSVNKHKQMKTMKTTTNTYMTETTYALGVAISTRATDPDFPLTLSSWEAPDDIRDEIFNDLFDEVENHAVHFIQNSNNVPPALIYVGQDETALVSPDPSCIGEVEACEFTETARLLCIAHAATMAVVAQETAVEIGNPLVKEKARALLMQAEWRDGAAKWYQKMIFNADGKFLGFSKPEWVGKDSDEEDRTLRILPHKVPSTEMRAAAFATLKAKGVLEIPNVPDPATN